MAVRTLLHLPLLATLATAAATPKIGGVNFVAEGFEGPLPYDDPASLTSLASARAVGVSLVVLSFPWYTDSINATTAPYRINGSCPSGDPLNNASSPSDEAVVTAVRAARALGMHVALRPMIDPNWDNASNRGVSRSDIGRGFTENATWDAWFDSYNAFITRWAAIAANESVEVFCIGAELRSTEAQSSHWRATFAAVRAIFPGIVYYSGEGEDIDWWDASDWIAQDAYPALTNSSADPATVTVDELVQAWNGTLEKWRGQSIKHGKPVLLSETGVCSIDRVGLFSQPYFFDCYSYAANDAVQAKYYQAVLQATWGLDFIVGVVFWKWAAQGGPTDPTFFPLNKTAATVMASYFGGAAVGGG